MDINYKKSSIAYCIVAIVIGLLFLIIPKQCIRIIVILLGVSSICNGIYNIVKIRNLVQDPEFQILILIRGLISIIIGLLAILLPLIFAGALWTVAIYMLAIYLLATAFMELFATVKMKNAGIVTKPYITEIVFSLVIGVLLFFIPPNVFGSVIMRIIGAIIIVFGAAYLAVMFKNKPLVVYSEEVPDDPNEGTN